MGSASGEICSDKAVARPIEEASWNTVMLGERKQGPELRRWPRYGLVSVSQTPIIEFCQDLPNGLRVFGKPKARVIGRLEEPTDRVVLSFELMGVMPLLKRIGDDGMQ